MPTTTLIDRPAYRLELGTERTRHGTVVKLITTLPRDERREVQFILDDEALARLLAGLYQATETGARMRPLVLAPRGLSLAHTGLDENDCDRN